MIGSIHIFKCCLRQILFLCARQDGRTSHLLLSILSQVQNYTADANAFLAELLDVLIRFIRVLLLISVGIGWFDSWKDLGGLEWVFERVNLLCFLSLWMDTFFGFL